MATNRRRIAGAVIVVALLAVVGVLAFQLGQRDSASPSPTGTSQPDSPGASSSAPRASDDPTVPDEPGLPTGPARAGGGGQESGPSDLPLGYSHDRAGAAQAATNYLMWMTSIRVADKKSADIMASAAAADAPTRAAVIKSLDVMRSGLENVKRLQAQPARGAYAVAGYTSSKARIYIWAPLVTTDTSGSTTTLWGISEIRLTWADGDWRLDQTLISREGGAAVDPSDPDGNPTAAEKQSILSRTPADPGEITDSADQSWFEYANAQH